MTENPLWIAKSVAVNLISRLPWCEHLHFYGQKLLGRHSLDAEEMFRRALELLRLVDHTGTSVRANRLLEIGTGWFPFVPLMASLSGAEEVVTVDIHPWLTRDNTVKTLRCLEEFLPTLAGQTAVAEREAQEQYSFMQEQIDRTEGLEDLLGEFGITYLCPYDLTENDFKSESFDIVFSSNVLEHVPPGALEEIHSETAKLLRPDGVCAHRFNPGDHEVELTGSTINFLTYHERIWRWLDGQGLSYHNRLRSSQHATLAQKAGLKLSFWADAIDRDALSRVESGKFIPAERFQGMPPEYLCAYYTWFVACKGSAERSVRHPQRVHWIDEVIGATEVLRPDHSAPEPESCQQAHA